MNKLSIQIISDLHLEFNKKGRINILNYVRPCSPNLAILGDLGHPHQDTFKEFLQQASDNYKKVFFLPGNHEYYQMTDTILTMDQIDIKMRDVCNTFDNVYYLNNEEYILEQGCVLLGSTLWSDIPISQERYIKKSMNDYNKIFVEELHYITGITPRMITDLHIKNVEWITNKLEEHKDKQVIIMTHHLPSFKMIHQKYKGSDINYAFASDLDYLMEQNNNLKFWLCGHTHFNMETTINNCECITNPYGYLGDNNNYKKEKTIELCIIE